MGPKNDFLDFQIFSYMKTEISSKTHKTSPYQTFVLIKNNLLVNRVHIMKEEKMMRMVKKVLANFAIKRM